MHTSLLFTKGLIYSIAHKCIWMQKKKKEKQKEKKSAQNTSSTREANKYKHISQNILSKQPNTDKLTWSHSKS